LVENIPDIIVRITRDGTVLAINRTVSQLPPEEAVGRSVYEFVAAEYLDELKDTIAKTFQTGKSGTCEVLGKGHSREDKAWYEIRVVPIKLDSKVVAATLISSDITESKKYQEEREILEARLRIAEKMEAVGILAGGVAHDLNNILASLVSYPDLILLELPDNSPLREPILTIQQAGEKAAAVVQDLLSLARRGSPDAVPLNCNDSITDYLSSLEFQKLKTDNPKITFETNFEQRLYNILGSPVHLSKVIHNLVMNAAAAIPDKGSITITTSNQYLDTPVFGYDSIVEGDYTILSITDTGCGISDKDLGKIFEPFYTKKADGRFGTGLGLSVVWGTVKDHKGYIDVKSTEGKGTTFYLYFPATKESIAKKKKSPDLEKYKGSGETILVVDDIKEQREIACSLLSKLGYSSFAISSGEEAVEYMKKNSAHLVLLDMILDPGIDGLETYKRILQLHPGQKAIIVSGFSETDRVREAQKMGAGEYIKKPFDLETLASAVRNELDK
jgi:PAS domain S-box-containing protein